MGESLSKPNQNIAAMFKSIQAKQASDNSREVANLKFLLAGIDSIAINKILARNIEATWKHWMKNGRDMQGLKVFDWDDPSQGKAQALLQSTEARVNNKVAADLINKVGGQSKLHFEPNFTLAEVLAKVRQSNEFEHRNRILDPMEHARMNAPLNSTASHKSHFQNYIDLVTINKEDLSDVVQMYLTFRDAQKQKYQAKLSKSKVLKPKSENAPDKVQNKLCSTGAEAKPKAGNRRQ